MPRSELTCSMTFFWLSRAEASITDDTQRGHGRGRRAVDALDQLVVVAAYDVHGEVALCAHRELGQQVLVLLPDREEHVRAQVVGAARVGRLDAGDAPLDGGVQGLGEDGVLLELAHGLPQAHPLGLQRRVVAAQFVLAARSEPTIWFKVACEEAYLATWSRSLLPPGSWTAACGPLPRQVPRVQVLDGAPEFDERARHLRLGVTALARQAAHGPFQHAVGLRGGGAHLTGAESGDLPDAARELGRAGVEGGELTDVLGGLAGHVGSDAVVDGDEAGGLLARDGRDGLGRGEREDVVAALTAVLAGVLVRLLEVHV